MRSSSIADDGSTSRAPSPTTSSPTDPGSGYYIFGQEGELTGFGNDNYLAYLDGAQNYNLNTPIVGMAAAPDGGGYWMVGSDGGVYASGDAAVLRLHRQPAPGPAHHRHDRHTRRQWLLVRGVRRRIFAYGDAQFYGSTGSQHPESADRRHGATPWATGYWLVASDGGIFAYGDAQFYGSTGAMHLNQPMVGMAPTPDSGGYWLVASDGGIFAYGDAKFYGSTGACRSTHPSSAWAHAGRQWLLVHRLGRRRVQLRLGRARGQSWRQRRSPS